MKTKIHTHMSFIESLESFSCRSSHGWGILECQCRLEFGHNGLCECFDKGCSMTWVRKNL